MDVCLSNCWKVSNYSTVNTKNNQPYFFTISPGQTSLEVKFDKTPLVKPAVERFPNPAILSPGFYEDNIDSLNYEGSWIIQKRTGPSSEMVHTAIEKQSSLRFSFKGTGVELGIVRYDDRNLAELCVDNSCQEINLFSFQLNWQHSYSILGLANKKHSVELRLKKGKAIDVDWIKIYGSPPVLNKGRHLPTPKNVQLTSGWKYSEEKHLFISPRGQSASINIKFKGKQLLLDFITNDQTGDAEICIDQHCKLYNLKSFRQDKKQIAIKPPKDEEHNVLINKKTSRYLFLSGIEVE